MVWIRKDPCAGFTEREEHAAVETGDYSVSMTGLGAWASRAEHVTREVTWTAGLSSWSVRPVHAKERRAGVRR